MRACALLVLALPAAEGGLLEELLASDRVGGKQIVQARPIPKGCYEWCHWEWAENCVKPQCQKCEHCTTYLVPRPPPTPPAVPGFSIPAYYFPAIDFEVVQGALYANGKYFFMKGISW